MPNDASAARLVSLADEEAVRGILVATVLDLWIPQCLETADDAIALVRDLHGQWNAKQ